MMNIFELRNDRKWENIREYVSRTISAINDDPEIYSNPKVLESILHYEFERELLFEFGNAIPSRFDLIVDIALGIIGNVPILNAISTIAGIGKSTKSYYNAQRAGLAFLMELKKFN